MCVCMCVCVSVYVRVCFHSPALFVNTTRSVARNSKPLHWFFFLRPRKFLFPTSLLLLLLPLVSVTFINQSYAAARVTAATPLRGGRGRAASIKSNPGPAGFRFGFSSKAPQSVQRPRHTHTHTQTVYTAGRTGMVQVAAFDGAERTPHCERIESAYVVRFRCRIGSEIYFFFAYCVCSFSFFFLLLLLFAVRLCNSSVGQRILIKCDRPSIGKRYFFFVFFFYV